MSVGESLVAPIRFGQIHLFTATHARTHARMQAGRPGRHVGFAAEGSGAAFIIDESEGWVGECGRFREDGIGIGERK